MTAAEWETLVDRLDRAYKEVASTYKPHEKAKPIGAFIPGIPSEEPGFVGDNLRALYTSRMVAIGYFWDEIRKTTPSKEMALLDLICEGGDGSREAIREAIKETKEEK